MKAESRKLLHEPTSAVISHATTLGMACLILAECERSNQRPLSYLNTFLLPAVRHRHIKFFFNEDGIPVGFVLWATLAEDVEIRMLAPSLPVLHESEWNEGDSVWIVDAVVREGYMSSVARYLRDVLFVDATRVRYVVRRPSRLSLHECRRAINHRIWSVKSARA